MDLNSLVFKVETAELDEAFKKVEKLASAVEDFSKVQDKHKTAEKAATDATIDSLKVIRAKAEALEAESKATLAQIKVEEKKEQQLKKTTKAQTEANEVLEEAAPAFKKSGDAAEQLVTRFELVSKYLGQGFRGSFASALAQLDKLGGGTEEQAKRIRSAFDVIGSLSKNPFDSSVGALQSINAEFTQLTNRANLLNAGLSLNTKQLYEYSRISAELSSKFKSQGIDPASLEGNKLFNTTLKELQQNYLDTAGKVNVLAEAEKRRQDALKIAEKEQARIAYEQITMMDQAVAMFRKFENEKAQAAEAAALRIKNANLSVAESIKRSNAIAANVEAGMSSSEASKRYDLGASGVEEQAINDLIAATKRLQAAEDMRRNASKGSNSAEIKANRELESALKRVQNEEEKMLSVLQSLNTEQNNGVSINEKAARSIANYERNLRLAGISGDEATKRLKLYKQQQLEVIAVEQKRQVQYLQRGLQPQIGDVVVSLAGGQNPLTVLLQQGDQIRGLIAQTGVEGEALRKAMQGALAGTVVSIKQTAGAMLSVLGGAVATVGKSFKDVFVGGIKEGFEQFKRFNSALTKKEALQEVADSTGVMVGQIGKIPVVSDQARKSIEDLNSGLLVFRNIGIAALITGLVAAGVAIYQIIKQENALDKALTLSGARLGLNKQQALSYVSALTSSNITTTKAIQVLTEMAKVGNLSKDSIDLVTKAAVNLEKYGGVAIEETVKQFSKIQEKPTEALTELGIAIGRVNPEIIAQVRLFEQQGEKAKAAALATKAAADAQNQAAESLKQNKTIVEDFLNLMSSKLIKQYDDFKVTLNAGLAVFSQSISLLDKYFNSGKNNLLEYLGLADKAIEKGRKVSGFVTDAQGNKTTYQGPSLPKTLEELTSDAVRTQKDLNALEDEYILKTKKREIVIGEIRRKTIDFYKAKFKLNEKDISEAEAAFYAQAKIKELIQAYDEKNKKQGKDSSIGYQSPKGNEAQNLEKQYGYAVDLAKKQYEAQRKIAKSNFEAGLTEKQDYITQDLSLLKEYEDKQLSMAESYEAANAKIYTETIQLAIKNRNAALASTAGSEDGVEKRKKIQEDYVQYLTNLGNNFESTQKKSEAAREALKSFIDERSVQAITAYGKAAEENEKAFEKFTKTQEEYLVNRDLERKLQDDINKTSGAEVEALKAKAEEQKRWTSEISRTQEALQKSKDAFESALGNPLASDKEIEAAFAAVEKNYKISQKVISDSRIAVENAASDAIVQYYKQAFDRITSGISDAIVTALFEGGKKGKTKLRDVLVQELKKPITATITVAVKTLFSDVAKSALTSLTGNTLNSSAGTDSGTSLLSNLSSLFGGNSFGAGISNFASDVGAELMRNGFSNAGSGISSAFGGAGSYSNLAYGAAGIGGGLVGGLFGGQGSLGGSLGSSLGLAIGGPIGAALGSLAGGLIGSLFGGGTPYNTGGVYTANQDGTGSRPQDRTTLSGVIQNLGKAGFEDFSKRGSDTLDAATKNLAEGLLSSVNPVLKSFSKDALDSITVAFRANGKKATGNLAIDGALSNFKTSTNDPTKAFAEFTKYAASAITDTLRDADLPKWVQELLDEVPKDVGLEGLQAILTTIKQVQELTKIFNNLPMQNLKVITSEASIELIKLAGGLDALTSSISSYYDNFYSAEEKTKIQIQNLTRDFKALGIDILPKTRDAFVNLVNSQDLTTEAGRKMYLELLNLQGGLSAILPPLESAVNTLEDFKQKTDDAYSNLEKAVSIQKEYYSTLRDNAKSSVDRLKGIFDLLSTNIRELYNQVQQTSGMSASAGRNLISTAARTGVVPDQDELSVAIASVRDSLAEENYATRFEAERDALILAGQLTQIKKVTGNNLTLAERQLKAAEDQLTALEAILVNAKKQIDAARGIDTSVKSVTQALKDLTAAILGETSSTGSTPVTSDPNAPGGSNGFVIGGSSSGTSSTSTSLALGTKTADGKYTIEQPTAAGTFVVEARADQQKRIEQASALYKQLDGQVSVKTALETFKAQGYSLLELGAAGGFAYSDLLSVAAKEGVPRFATGGSFGGGLRLVGENGPELEHTGPSRIYSNNQTRNMLSDEGTKAEIQALRSDLRAQASATTAVMQEMLKINKRWDSDGLPEVRAVA